MKLKIIGTGAYLPERVVTNEEIACQIDSSDAWIRERTGIISRHIITEEETTVTMASEAAGKALEDAKLNALALDMILVSTISSDVIIPGTACEVQRKIGAENAVCFDLGGTACAGFVFALNTVQAYMEAGMIKNALVIGSESLSRLIDWSDRSSCILFGDGAGAVVVTAEEGAGYSPVMYSDGKRGHVLSCKSRNDMKEVQKNPNDYYVQMDGREVFRFATRSVPSMIEELLEKNSVTKDEISCYILHQANARIIESIARRMKLPEDRFPVNIQTTGNTSSASIPILLDEMKKKKQLKPGDRLILAGFGAGLSWGATMIEW